MQVISLHKQAENLKKKLDKWEEALKNEPDHPDFDKLFDLYTKKLTEYGTIHTEIEALKNKTPKQKRLFD